MISLRAYLVLLSAVVAWLSIWEFSVLFLGMNQFLYPTPVEVGSHVVDILVTGTIFTNTASPTENIYYNLYVTLTELGAGFIIVVGISVLIGFLTSESKVLNDTLEPFMLTLLAIPGIIFYPLIYLLLGLGPISVITYAVVAATIQTTLLTISAFKNADTVYLKVLQSMGANRMQVLRMAKFPSVAPALLTALTYGLGTTYVVVIVGEMIASPMGIGSLIERAGTLVATADMLALIAIVVCVIAIPIQAFVILIKKQRI